MMNSGPVIIQSKHSDLPLGVEGNSLDDLAGIIQVAKPVPARPWATMAGSFVLEPVEGSGERCFVRCAVSGKYWDIEGGSNENCTRLIQFRKHGGPNQQFEFEAAGGGYYIIKCVQSGKVLDDEMASMEIGARIIQFYKHGGDNQLFIVTRTRV
jgi:hypothetical protein